MAHIATLGQGDRLWFERCEVVGGKVLAPHENATDGKPAVLSIPVLRRRFGCDAQAAFEYGELLLALEADRHVIASYAERVEREGIETVCRELRDLVVELDLVEGGEDPVDEADELPSEGTEVADPDDVDSDGDTPAPGAIGYHVVGDLFEAKAAEPSWETEQADGYRTLLKRIARAALLAHPWPGNIRELANAVERALILAEGGLLTAAHFGLDAGRPRPEGPSDPPAAPEALAALERRAIQAALEHTRGNKTQAAALLGITRTQLHTRVKRFGLTS
jgi:hypothetical protein